MSRPAKSSNLTSKHLTKVERFERKKIEDQLKGGSDKILPPKHLSKTQKTIFKKIVNELKESGTLGNLDIYILGTASIAIDRLNSIETMINEDQYKLMNGDLMRAKDKYTKDFYRCCNELSLSPQSRAKVSNMNVKAKKDKVDPLLLALKGGKRA